MAVLASHSVNFGSGIMPFLGENSNILVAGVVIVSVVAFIVVYCRRSLIGKGSPDSDSEAVKPRFRKRDKVIFYGKKMLRKVRQFSAVPREDGYRSRIRKRQKVMLNFAKQLLHFQENEPERQLKEPPPAFFEADWADSEGNEPHLPTEVVYMLKSVKVFGYFEKPLFFELCKYIETKFVPANTPLFRTGQIDESIYVVQSGKLNVYLQEKDGSELLVKEASTGDSVYSVLSILDVLAGRKPARLQVTARAVIDTHILKLPAKAFQTVFEQYPDSLVRVVQIIMLRLQQVSFMALHDFLGLSSELLNPVAEGTPLKSLSVNSLPANIGTPTQTVAEPTPKLSLDLADRDRDQTSATSSPDNSAGASENATSEAIDIEQKSVPKQKKKLNRSVSFSSAVYVHDTSNSSGPAQPMSVPIKRSRSLGIMRQLSSDTEDGLTDFDIACGRARVFSPVNDSSPRKGKWEVGGGESPQGSPSNADMRFDFPYRSSSSKAEARRQSSFDPVDPDEEEVMLAAATKDIAELLELHDEEMLDEMLTLAKIPADTVLVKQGEQECSLYFVVTGALHVSQKNMNDEKEHFLFKAKPGEFVGVLSVLTGEPSFFTIKALHTCHLVILSKAGVYSLMKAQPKTVLNIAQCIVHRLSPFVRRIDFALDWMHVEAGRAVYRQNEQADCVYIVLNGRLRSIVTSDSGKKTLVGEYGRGELVGVVEVMTQTSRAATVHAVRDTELAKLPEGLLNTIKQQFPQVVLRLIRLLGERILGHYKRGHIPSSEPSIAKPSPVENQQLGSNLGTIAFIPASEDVPLINFTFELCMAFNAIGPALLLTSELVQSKLGSSALDSMHEYRLATWLGQQEDLHRIVLYQADSYMSAWTKRCIRQADCIIIVARSDQEPTVGQLEMQLENMQVRAHKELVLLHRFDLNHPLRISHTIDWLNARGWISTHHHIRCPRKIFSKKSLVERYAKDPDGYDFPERNSDFARLARRLTGTSIGLVLGGGGARGLSHVGVIKALEEAGIPIDMVGGTSIGALVGAVYAEDADVVRMTRRVRDFSIHDMASLFKTVLDLTYPFTSMFSGYGFNASIRSALGEKQIEDLLLPYFTITTDITSSKMRIHRDGSLWRYVRSSMSLSGYLPPLCDPKDGHLLLDGGYVNNLPADVMKSMMGAQSIIAIDVGSEYSGTLTNYGDHLSGWWLLWKKWNPFAEPVKVPDMAEIQTRLAYVSCMKQLEEVKESTYCEYIRPPIDRYKTLDFGRFDEIMEVGHKHGKALFQSWSKRTSVISSVLTDWQPGQNRGPQLYAQPPKASVSLISPSFSNLARIISHMEPQSSSSYENELDKRNPRHTKSDPFLYEEDEDGEGHLMMRPRSGSLDDENRRGAVIGHGPDTSEDEAGYVSEGSVQLRRRRIDVNDLSASM